jgi:N-acetyl-gamma-glutamylphosphate reductase
MIRAAIVGASGYAGGELLRLLLAHPQVEVTQITSETYARQYAYFVHPNLRGHTDLRFTRLADLVACDLLFLALPHGHAADRIEEFALVWSRTSGPGLVGTLCLWHAGAVPGAVGRRIIRQWHRV